MKHAIFRRLLALVLALCALALLCAPAFAAQEAFTDQILTAMKQPMVLGSSTFEYEGVTFNRVLIPRYVLERYEKSEYEILPGQSDERVKAVKRHSIPMTITPITNLSPTRRCARENRSRPILTNIWPRCWRRSTASAGCRRKSLP